MLEIRGPVQARDPTQWLFLRGEGGVRVRVSLEVVSDIPTHTLG